MNNFLFLMYPHFSLRRILIPYDVSLKKKRRLSVNALLGKEIKKGDTNKLYHLCYSFIPTLW